MQDSAETLRFSALLRQQRLAAGLTQAALGERAGLSERTVQDLERSIAHPRRETVRRLVAALALSPDVRARFEASISAPRPNARRARRDATPRREGPLDGEGRRVAARNHNLPFQPTPLLARADDIRAARQQLLRNDVRLLTLTGPGGVGKTRLALAVAEALLDTFPDGAWLVDLAPLADAALVASAIAGTLGVQQVTDRPLLDSLCDHLRDRRVLLMLDNAEHVLAATPDLAQLLQACPDLKLLVTSRVALRSRWEHIFAVAPLDARPVSASESPEIVAAVAAVMLFIQRAQAAVPDFALTIDNASAVAELCVRLDGLPLAIELGAARCPVLSPAEMLARLPGRLDFLVDGPPDQPARHRTLRDAIAWSYELLPSAEKALFRRLSLFAGRFDLSAADAVCTEEARVVRRGIRQAPSSSAFDPGPSTLDALSSLVRASLVRRDAYSDGEPRFRMLETVRAYALESLEAADELPGARRRHAAHYLSFAEDVGARLNGQEQIPSLNRLQAEHDNLRAALRWALDVGDAIYGLRLAAAIGWFWWVRGHLSEGRDWLGRLLALPGAEARTLTRAAALDAAGFLAFQQGAFPEALALHGEALAIREEAGDGQGLRESLHGLGDAHMFPGNLEPARNCFERGLANAEELGDTWGEALFSFHLAHLTGIRDSRVASCPLYERSLALSREVGNTWGISFAAAGLGRGLLAAGDLESADLFLREALVAQKEVGDQFAFPLRLTDMAGVAAARGDWERVLRLEGAAAAFREAGGYARLLLAPAEVEDRIAMARRNLDPATQAAAWADGLAMSRDEAVTYALALDEAPMAQPVTTPPVSPLSPREREVAALIGRGLTNRQIGEALTITEGTARIHVAHVLAKLDLRSRVQVAAWAAERGLLSEPSPMCE